MYFHRSTKFSHHYESNFNSCNYNVIGREVLFERVWLVAKNEPQVVQFLYYIMYIYIVYTSAKVCLIITDSPLTSTNKHIQGPYA